MLFKNAQNFTDSFSCEQLPLPGCEFPEVVWTQFSGAAVVRCCAKQVFSEISQKSQENTCPGFFF